MKALIIDDEANSRHTLRNLLARLCPQVEVIAEASSAEEGLQMIQQHQPGLIFLDIEMPGQNGFELLNALQDISFEVIFTTAYHEYAVKAFRFSAIDYLLKPIDPDELMSAVKKFEEKTVSTSSQQVGLLKEMWKQLSGQVSSAGSPQKIALSNQEGLHIVEVQDIMWCEALGSYTKFHLKHKQNMVVSRIIKEYEEILSDYGFVRVHQSYLVNLAFVTRYIKGDGGQLILQDGTEIEVSRRKKEDVLEALSKIIR